MFQLIIRFRLGPRLDFPLVIKTDFISAVTSATFHTHKCVSCVSCEKRPVCLPPPACHTPAAWSHRPRWERQYLSRWALSAPLMASRNTVSPPRSLWKHTHTLSYSHTNAQIILQQLCFYDLMTAAIQSLSNNFFPDCKAMPKQMQGFHYMQ